MLYLTDTGRRWNGNAVSVRDKTCPDRMRFRTSTEIVHAARNKKLPAQIMITVHPQRWNDRLFPWVKELVWQNIKNVIKWGVVKLR